MANVRFSRDQKLEFLKMADQPGAKKAEIAAENNFHPTSFSKWADQLGYTFKNGRSKAKKSVRRSPAPERRRYTSTDRAKVVELEKQLGEAYVRIHKLEQYILEKELGIK